MKTHQYNTIVDDKESLKLIMLTTCKFYDATVGDDSLLEHGDILPG